MTSEIDPRTKKNYNSRRPIICLLMMREELKKPAGILFYIKKIVSLKGHPADDRLRPAHVYEYAAAAVPAHWTHYVVATLNQLH